MAIDMNAQAEQINAEQKAKKSALQMLARDEKVIGYFFAALATQYFLHKDMLVTKLTSPNFIFPYAKNNMCASQRVFIKDIITNPKFKKVLDEMQSLYGEYCNENVKKTPPQTIFLSRINKAFLIRQIFGHGDSVNERFTFIESLLDRNVKDLNEIEKKLWHLPVEEQIIILSRIFDNISDSTPERDKTLTNAYRENLHRITVDQKQHPEKHSQIYPGNLEAMRTGLHEYDTQEANTEKK